MFQLQKRNVLRLMIHIHPNYRLDAGEQTLNSNIDGDLNAIGSKSIFDALRQRLDNWANGADEQKAVSLKQSLQG